MKKILSILLLVVYNCCVQAQGNITAMEYFVDTDPGFGNGMSVTVTPGKTIATNFIADLNGIEGGIHFIYLRAYNDSGWSNTFVSPFLINSSGNNDPLADLVELEYFFDTDPGYGNANNLSITNNPILALNATLDFTGISTGFHMMHLRIKDSNGLWSHTYSRPVITSNTTLSNIVKAEYFFDADPGYGLANNLPLTLSNVLDNNYIADLSGLTPGIHLLTVRIEDETGNWSIACNKPVLVNGNVQFPKITYAETQIDSFTSYGSGSPLAITSDNIIDDILNVDLIGISSGIHKLFVAVKDENNNWSLTQRIDFCVAPQAIISTDSIVCLGSASNFTDLSENTNGTTLYYWDIDNDGVFEYTTQGDVSHNYITEGNYTTTLILDKDSVCADTTTLSISVEPNSAIANFKIDTTCIGSPANINNLTTGATSNTIYQWDLNDDNLPDTALTNSFDYTFSAGGKHIINLTVYDSPYCKSSFTDSTFVDSNAVFAEFSVSTTCVENGTIFTDLSTGTNSSTTYFWDMDGDGNPEYTGSGNQLNSYSAGTYSPVLILNSNTICADTFSTSVIVDSLGTIKGTVFNDAGIISDGYVKIFRYRSTGIIPLVDSVRIDVNGNYEINNLNPDNYLIKAFPTTGIYPNSVATYVDSTVSWSKAAVINSLCDTVINIGLLDISLISGDGIISGFLFTIDTTNRAGDPIPGIDISLEQIPGGIVVKQTETDENGHYEFKNLPAYSYKIHVDIPGALMDSTYEVTINDNDTAFENLNFVFDSASIYIDKTTGIKYNAYRNLNTSLNIFPNPFNDELRIQFVLDKNSSNVTLELFDVIGKKISTLINQNLPSGLHQTKFNSNELNLNGGVYFLNLQIDDHVTETVRIIKTN